MRPWDIDDCEVAIAQLKEQVYSLTAQYEELQNRIWDLENEQWVLLTLLTLIGVTPSLT